MTKSDIFLFLNCMAPEMNAEQLDSICEAMIYHIEEKIRQEVLHLDQRFDHQNLALAAPYDDVYWTYILSLLHLKAGNMEAYRESRKLFEEAWENFCRQVFVQKEAFKLAPWYPGDEEAV